MIEWLTTESCSRMCHGAPQVLGWHSATAALFVAACAVCQPGVPPTAVREVTDSTSGSCIAASAYSNNSRKASVLSVEELCECCVQSSCSGHSWTHWSAHQLLSCFCVKASNHSCSLLHRSRSTWTCRRTHCDTFGWLSKKFQENLVAVPVQVLFVSCHGCFWSAISGFKIN